MSKHRIDNKIESILLGAWHFLRIKTPSDKPRNSIKKKRIIVEKEQK